MKLFDGKDGRAFLDWLTVRMNAQAGSMDDTVRQNFIREILRLGDHELVAQPAKPKKEVNLIEEVLNG